MIESLLSTEEPLCRIEERNPGLQLGAVMTPPRLSKTATVSSVMADGGKSPLIVKGEEYFFLQLQQITEGREPKKALIDPMNMDNIRLKNKGMMLERKTGNRQGYIEKMSPTKALRHPCGSYFEGFFRLCNPSRPSTITPQSLNTGTTMRRSVEYKHGSFEAGLTLCHHEATRCYSCSPCTITSTEMDNL